MALKFGWFFMKYKLAFLLLALSVNASCFADDPVCKKCVKVREYNEAHPENNYEWYDDYLKDKKEGKAKETSIEKDNAKEEVKAESKVDFKEDSK